MASMSETRTITREDVAHLARRSRLALGEDELDRFAGQLDVIIAAVARVQEVAADGIPPTTHAVPVTNVFRDDTVVPPIGAASAPSRNPWDLSRVPGGSSGGSAAAVASFETPLAMGTDTGGSIRQPGAVCGIVGVKPTYGGSSRYGVVAFASSLDTPGPLARTVLDAALLHEAVSGHDPCDSTSVDAPVPPVVAAARQADVAGLRVGVVTELG